MKTQCIPCPKCNYQALSLFDLEEHGEHTHGRVDDMAVISQPPLEQPEPQPIMPPWVEAIPWTGGPILAIPEADPTFWVDKPVLRFLYAVGRRSVKGEVVNVLLEGPTGTGKSSLPKEFAANWKRPFFTMHCQLVTEQGDWWGTTEMSPERGTYFQKAALVDAVETQGCVILLDEANRTHPENLNVLFGMLDHRRRAWIPTLHRELAVAPGVVFFVTLNEGLDYVGTNTVDRALKDRISNTINTTYPPRQVEASILVKRTRIDEETAWKLTGFAHTIRNNPKLRIGVSTRQLLECAALVKEGLLLEEAVLFSIVNATAESADRKALLQSLQMTRNLEEVCPEPQWDEEG